MQKNYYFSPTSPNLSVEQINEQVNKMREKSYDFCTPWQTNSHLNSQLPTN